MRNFTPSEKAIVNKLIEWSSGGQSIRLGDVLLKLFPEIEYIKPSDDKDNEFYKHTIKICYNEKKVSLSTILEAINLFDLLVQRNYIVIKKFFPTNNIGEEHQGMYLLTDDVHYIDMHIMNYYDFDLWDFLCSHFYVTNALIDYAKDFKTPEQRRHNCTKNISVVAIIVSVFIGILSPFISNIISDKSNKESLEQVIYAIKEQKTISIDKFPNMIPDTLNIKLTESTDMQQ